MAINDKNKTCIYKRKQLLQASNQLMIRTKLINK